MAHKPAKGESATSQDRDATKITPMQGQQTGRGPAPGTPWPEPARDGSRAHGRQGTL